MYKRILCPKILTLALVTVNCVFFNQVSGQKATSPKPGQATAWDKPATPLSGRPRLVVGIVVDQMRWDYLYRFNNRYTNGGFKRMLREGFSCENTLINYTPTVTAAGHTCVYTGSVPAVHGIVGNEWFSPALNREIYCAEDSTVNTVGSTSNAGKMSPENMQVTTIGDELRLATNFKSKVVGVAIKDRGSILPAGHSATAAYWYDGTTGNWITSSYYMNRLPDWVENYNREKWPAQYLNQPWNTLYPIESYTQSAEDNKAYEGATPVFPHDISANANKGIAGTPYGNTMTLAFAQKAVNAYRLGNNGVTDMLTVSLSSTDYVGHQYGPNSIEAEDTYLRLDKDLAAFFKYLDATVGKGQYLVFLTADHGVAHVPGFSGENKLPGGSWSVAPDIKQINAIVKERFGVEKAVIGASNYQLYLDHDGIEKAGKSVKDIAAVAAKELLKDTAIANAFPLSELMNMIIPNPLRNMLINGYYAKRSGDIQYIVRPGYIEGGKTGTTHGLWYPYDAHIPLVWMGWGIHPGKSNKLTGMTDIAPTIAALLRIQMPSGNVGLVIDAIAH
ncbi:alkaline phosphatase PafA [Chitinophaga sancti]|uniref:alkaline phosphatase PafA n=1 Tax=Chitinophaga sancti TaxID=1004 RepID=UPI002A749344|nr:alkaline phosphatase PafA [Chitinophaga sancti]WPQ65085.1 alkaline phosphatase PafA [Chitinophaga sancti]